jgi:hypothetical protein
MLELVTCAVTGTRYIDRDTIKVLKNFMINFFVKYIGVSLFIQFYLREKTWGKS